MAAAGLSRHIKCMKKCCLWSNFGLSMSQSSFGKLHERNKDVVYTNLNTRKKVAYRHALENQEYNAKGKHIYQIVGST